MRQAGIPLETLGSLKLTSAQKAKIAGIADKSTQELQAKIRAANGDFQSLMPAFQQARAQTHTSVLAVLTSPQKAIIDKYEKAHPRPAFGGPGGGFGGPGGGRRGGGFGGPGGPGGRPGAPRS